MPQEVTLSARQPGSCSRCEACLGGQSFHDQQLAAHLRDAPGKLRLAAGNVVTMPSPNLANVTRDLIFHGVPRNHKSNAARYRVYSRFLPHQPRLFAQEICRKIEAEATDSNARQGCGKRCDHVPEERHLNLSCCSGNITEITHGQVHDHVPGRQNYCCEDSQTDLSQDSGPPPLHPTDRQKRPDRGSRNG